MANRRSRYKDINIEMTLDEPDQNTVESPAEMETNGPETKNGIIQGATFIRLRDNPSFDTSNVIELLPEGSKVVVLGKGNGFYKVRTLTGLEGYIALPFLKEE